MHWIGTNGRMPSSHNKALGEKLVSKNAFLRLRFMVTISIILGLLAGVAIINFAPLARAQESISTGSVSVSSVDNSNYSRKIQVPILEDAVIESVTVSVSEQETAFSTDATQLALFINGVKVPNVNWSAGATAPYSLTATFAETSVSAETSVEVQVVGSVKDSGWSAEVLGIVEDAPSVPVSAIQPRSVAPLGLQAPPQTSGTPMVPGNLKGIQATTKVTASSGQSYADFDVSVGEPQARLEKVGLALDGPIPNGITTLEILVDGKSIETFPVKAGNGAYTLTSQLSVPQSVVQGQKITMRLKGASGIYSQIPGSTGYISGNPGGVQLYGTVTNDGSPSLPEVSPTPDLQTIGSGNSVASLSSDVLTISTEKQGSEPTKEIKVQVEVPGFTGAEGWSLKIAGQLVDPSQYDLRADSDTVFFTFKDLRDIPVGNRVEASGRWSGKQQATGSLTLWTPKNTNTEPDQKEGISGLYPLAKESYLLCKVTTRNQLRISANPSEQGSLSKIVVRIPDNAPIPDPSDPKILLQSSAGSRSNGTGFTAEINGRTLTLTLTPEVALRKLEGVSVVIPDTARVGTRYTDCNITFLGVGKEAPKPTVCSAIDRPVDDRGLAMPWNGNQSRSVARKPARTLTAEEKARGNTVYVTASTPNSQSRNFSQLYYQESAGTSFKKIGEQTGWVVNALAYNASDNWLYAVSQGRIGYHFVEAGTTSAGKKRLQIVTLEDPCFPAGHLLQIDPLTGEVHNLGKITAPNSTGYGISGGYNRPWPNDLWGGVNVGFFDRNNDYWVANASLSGSGHLYKIDVAKRVATSTGNTATVCGKDEQNYCARSEDYAILPPVLSTGNYAWGIKNGWAANGRIILERIDISNGSIRTWDITGYKTASGQSIPIGHQWGKAWTYGNGNLGFGTSSSGASSTVLQLKVTDPDSTNPIFELVSLDNTAPTAYNTDGTSNGLVPVDVDLEVNKTYLGEDQAAGRVTWRIDVFNKSASNGSSGFLINDEIPAGFTDLKIKTPPNAQVSVNQGPSQTDPKRIYVQATFGPLPAGQSTWIELSAKAPEGAIPGCVENTVSIIGNENDPNSGNNSSTAECENKDVTIRIKKVDFNESTQDTPLNATFKLFEAVASPDGSLSPSSEGKEIVTTDRGILGEATVTPGKSYFLVETQSPRGYSLLPRPILLRVESDKDGKVKLVFPEQKDTFPVLQEKILYQDGVITIPVADVTVGNLPRTGGNGIAPIVLLGAMLVMFGVTWSRIKIKR